MLMTNPHVAARGASWPAAVVFDLDGTLVDSAGDITTSLNELLVARQLAPFPEETVRDFVGDGSKALVERAFQTRGVLLGAEELRIAVSSYDAIYGTHLVERTYVYDGALEVMADLKARGIRMGICTNKFQDKAERVATHFGLDKYAEVVVGGISRRPGKPSPIMLIETLEALEMPREEAVLVGDSTFDVQCARAAGVTVIGVTFGYSQTPMRKLGPDAVIDSYAEFAQACDSLRAKAA
ncbi:Phosphoglycolate phosphatase [Afipia felis]|uniref:phosphoglycolate phosphatase n=3 Tax=Afipia felis TaxID=1035 RepID=A0A380WD82_AFIFE|nr:phosphoglycolate phosphatase, bacterial [Afipia felis ATCC 53690]SUU78701.1 Phosphoglycolate phosphatase [Afipia felis]SUU86766.1 Phosphoglycolate phosphatase [Afipia felis]